VTRARFALTAAAAGALVASVAAQQIFRTGTDVVLLPTTVTDGAGRLVPGLDKADFQVYEDGVLQEITNFSRDPQPIALSLALDTSTSMELKIGVVQEAASGFVRRLGPNDTAQIIDFDSQAKVLQTFTHDQDALEQAVRRTQAGGSTSLYNAIYTAISELKRARVSSADEVRRQAIVLLSDGEDTSSIVPYEDVLDLAKRSEVILYAIGLREKDTPASHGWNEAEFVLRSLAQETGGRVFFVSDINQLSGLYGQIADELANQYMIGYTSKNPKRDGAWRRIVVKVSREGVVARTKSGYFGPTIPR
jgi:Ca-activated chloride channel family protein